MSCPESRKRRSTHDQCPCFVRPLKPSDENRWRALFREYRALYQLEESEEVVARVWGWFMASGHECQAPVAESPDGIVAIGHYRRFARPSTGTVGLWLDDLFTAPEARNIGAARAMIQRLTELAGAEGHSVVRWITAQDNHQAQGLYEQVPVRARWLTYDAAPAPVPASGQETR
ncbi:GNAT family N-acetyltransferase [Glutamicibacter ectropisis]|uniref:GNAT family N-acetyltransferase n=1 Tax=Glutamicibacter ectropisis TaxID=3046593 RepID=A0AAU6WD86_9MICC